MSSYAYIPRTVFITGATGDFGAAIARRFDKIGSKLILHGRTESKLSELESKLDNVEKCVCFDLKDKEQTISALTDISREFDTIDLLINNAGGAFGQDMAFCAELEDWEDMIAVNNTALIRITRYILEKMVQRKRGHIINIGSIAGTYPYPGGNVYCAVKAFTAQFSLALRADLQGKNIRVTNLEPGMVETQFSLVRFKGDKQKAKKVYENTKPLTAEDVAESVLWVATLPEHFNVNRIEMMPTTQAFGPLDIYRTSESSK
jgi:3-hydroxy acid dehydrogenase/malonic semialdehyde reductase